MAIQAVMFDFSGTLFRLEQNETWLTELTDPGGTPLDIAEQAELMRRMTAPVTQVADFDDEHRYAWDNRDLDPELHRKVYLEALRQSGIPRRDQAESLYRRLVDPLEWTPYPDTDVALKSLAGRGIRIGVLSNIPFDIRPAFAARGLDAYVAAFVLSFEVGAMKPDPAVFRLLTRALDVAPEHALMVGDSEEADGGARRLGCAFALVEALPTGQRADGLLTALRERSVL